MELCGTLDNSGLSGGDGGGIGFCRHNCINTVEAA